MGFYINPKECSKEMWLHQRMRLASSLPPTSHKRRFGDVDCTWVCLVDNGAFTAAAILATERELQAFTHPDDKRLKIFFLIPDTDVAEFLPWA